MSGAARGSGAMGAVTRDATQAATGDASARGAMDAVAKGVMDAATGDASAREAMDAVARPVLVLTPEELDLLEEAHAHSLGVEPERDVPVTPARAQALHSLQGRGLLGGDARLLEGGALTDLVLLMLDVRVAADALLVVERRLAGSEDRPDLRLLHLLPSGGVVEDLHPGGWHGLDLHVDPDLLAEQALATVLPPDARAGEGDDLVLDLGDPDAAASWGAVLLAELTLARPAGGTEESVLLAVGSSGCHLATDPGRTDGRVTFVPTTPEVVQTMVREWVSRVVDPVEDQGEAGASGIP